MGFFDYHVSLRIGAGLQRIAANKLLWDDILDGSVDDRTRDLVWARLFVLEDGAETPTPRVIVRTAWPRLSGDGRPPADPAAVSGQGSAQAPTVTIDLVDERTIKKELGGLRRLDQENVEILVSAGTKDEVRCLHQTIKEIVEDSIKWFLSLGYSMVHADGPSGDLRPTDTAFLGMPHLLGAFNRYLRCQATINRKGTRIFTEERGLVDPADIRVNHIDSKDEQGNQGAVKPEPDST